MLGNGWRPSCLPVTHLMAGQRWVWLVHFSRHWNSISARKLIKQNVHYFLLDVCCRSRLEIATTCLLIRTYLLRLERIAIEYTSRQPPSLNGHLCRRLQHIVCTAHQGRSNPSLHDAMMVLLCPLTLPPRLTINASASNESG